MLRVIPPAPSLSTPRLGSIKLFNAEVSPERYWRGPRSQDMVGGRLGGGVGGKPISKAIDCQD